MQTSFFEILFIFPNWVIFTDMVLKDLPVTISNNYILIIFWDHCSLENIEYYLQMVNILQCSRFILFMRSSYPGSINNVCPKILLDKCARIFCFFCVFWFDRYFLNTFFLDRTAFLRVRLIILQIIVISDKIVKQLLETLYRKKTDLVSDQTYQEL